MLENIETQTQTVKNNYSFRDFKRIKMTLPCRQKTISIIKRNLHNKVMAIFIV